MFAVPVNTVAPAGSTGHGHPVLAARRFAADRARWRHLLRYDPDERYAVLAEAEGEQEIWLLSWLPGQRAELHDHGASAGAFTVVSGVLTETVARGAPRQGAMQTVHPVAEGQSRAFGPGYVHEVRNDGPDPAVSVHVYRYGGRTMRPYHLDPLTGPVRG